MKRTTVKRDPLGEIDTEIPEHGERTVSARPRKRMTAKPSATKISDGLDKRAEGRSSQGKCSLVLQAAGGRLELLGGSFGTGVALIKRLDDARHLGFVSPTGDTIDLEADVDSVAASPDAEEHRFLSAAGWAWAASALVGPLGIVLGGGLRLLNPRRMMLRISFRDGRALVARTDFVTSRSLLALN